MAIALAFLVLPGAPRSAGEPDKADDFLIVDCLLPAQIRQLGQNVTFLAARKAIRASAHDCALRGGEFSRGDAGGPAGLRVWLPAAEKGDAQAQTYVGEIFERGLAGQPDYAAAVTWYRRAADQGFSRALIALGALVQQGLGTPRDPALAAKLFRSAAGLQDDLPGDAPGPGSRNSGPAKVASANDAAKDKQLSDQARQIDELKRKLRTSESDVDKDRARLKALQGQLAKSQAPGQGAADAKAERLGKSLEERDRALERSKSAVAELQAKLTALQTPAPSAPQPTADPAKLKQAETELANAQAAMASQQRDADKLRAELQATQANSAVRETELRQSIAKLEREMQDRQATITNRDREIKKLQDQVASIDAAPAARGGAAPAPQPIAIPVAQFGHYHALVIGIDNYKRLSTLKTPVSDAKAISQILRDEYGFDVVTLLDANRYDILAALNKFRQSLTDQDNLLIYYAGHGVLDSVNQRGNWMPVDAEPDNPANWISNIQITDMLNAMAARQILVVADSCYSGTLTRDVTTAIGRARSETERAEWYKIMISKPSRVALTSGGLEPVADAGGGGHSLFADLFIKALHGNSGAVSTQEVYQEIEPVVATRMGQRNLHQVPEYAPIKMAGHEAGDFVFVKPR